MVRSPDIRILIGLACVHLALWVGPYCSYADLHEYATITEQLWRHGTFALPDGLQSRFCWGFPVLMLPFQALASGVESLSGRSEVSRWVLCLVPLMATLGACWLAAAWRPDQSPLEWTRSRLLALVLLGLAAPVLQFSRRLHLEPVVGCLLLAALGSIRGGSLAAAGGGAALGMAVSCHFAYLPGASILAAGLALLRWRSSDRRGAIIILVVYAVVLGVTPLSNLARYGALFQDGYSRQEEVGWHLRNIIPNLPSLALVLLASPWAVLAWGHRLRPMVDLAMVVRVAIVIQVVIWLGTWQFREYPLRYLCAWVMVAAILLPGALAWIRTWGRSAIPWTVTASLIATVIALAGWRGMRPIEIDHAHPLYPGRAITDVWYVSKADYVQPEPYRWIVGGMPDTVAQAPPSWWGWLFALTLIGTGSMLMIDGLRRSQPDLAGTEHP